MHKQEGGEEGGGGRNAQREKKQTSKRRMQQRSHCSRLHTHEHSWLSTLTSPSASRIPSKLAARQSISVHRHVGGEAKRNADLILVHTAVYTLYTVHSIRTHSNKHAQTAARNYWRAARLFTERDLLGWKSVNYEPVERVCLACVYSASVAYGLGLRT